MKKYLALFLSFIILSSAALIGVQVYAAADAVPVVYTEHTLTGDKSEIDGIELFLELHCAEHLFWDCELTLGEKVKTDTKFSYINDYKRPVTEPRGSFDLSFGLNNFGASGSGDLLEDRDFFGQYDMIAAAAEKTPAGKTHTEIFRLADFYEYYPIAVDMHLHDLWFDSSHTSTITDRKYGTQIESLFAVLTEMFKIPVADNDYREIQIKKRPDGTVSEVHSSPADNDNYTYLSTFSAITDDAIYFSILPMTHEGPDVSMDISMIKGGWGIYRLPYTVTDYETPYYAESKTMVQLRPDLLSCVFPLETGVIIEDFFLSEDASVFYLTTRRHAGEEDEISLTVIDRETMTEVQSVPLFNCLPDDYISLTASEENFILYKIAYKKFAVIEKKDGRWQTAFVVEDESINTYWSSQEFVTFSYDTPAAFDGERLVIAGYSNERGGNGWDRATSFLSTVYLSVYSAEGNLYTGKFTSSLDTGTYLQYNNICRPKDEGTLILRLP
ncbi:MAG: hypothetical protein IJC71_05750 [Clostridia bacterium]|nr:hypothetical protein [Clostridia bacterium]